MYKYVLFDLDGTLTDSKDGIINSVAYALKKMGESTEGRLDQQDLPDIVAQRLTDLDRRLGALENAAQGDTPPTAAQIAARQKS